MNAGGAIIVMSSFAAVWWMIGAAQFGRDSLMMYAAGIVISGLIIALGWRRGRRPATPEERKRRGRIVGIASALEGVAIFSAAIVLGKLGRSDLITPAVAIIVGVHFLPLARWFPAPIYYFTGVLLVAVGVAGSVVQVLASRILTVCVGAAAVLWLSCGMVLLRSNRQRD